MNGEATWADALQALRLFAADPVGLGGLAVRARAGPVRDEFLALLYDALPQETPIRRLPLHVGDDRLLGGLDLPATLQAGTPIEQKGLLAEADGGIVVLTMAERIESMTAARLRAALDQGAVALQRDGLSRLLPTRFAIVALDEGAEPDEHPPPSLLDRLAFHLDLTDISLRNIADSAGTATRAADGTGLIDPLSIGPAPNEPVSAHPVPVHPLANRATSIAPRFRPSSARASRIWVEPSAEGGRDRPSHFRLPGVDDESVTVLCQTAMALGVASIRAPLLALRAARIAAAQLGHDHITEEDLALAARLVLAPRATALPTPEASDAQDSSEPDHGSDAAPDPDGANPDQQASSDKPLADIVLDAVKAALPLDLLAQLTQNGGRGLARAPGRAGQAKVSTKRGRPIGTRQGEPGSGARLHLLETLKAAAPWQTIRRRSDRFEVRRDDFRVVRFRQRIGTTTVFAVDASGSAALHRLAEAKGAVELLLADCYVRRDQVALIAFRGRGATLLLPPTGSLLRAKRSLAGLPGGGPTPLAAGIEAALTLAETVRRAGRTPVITLLTDAHANIARDGTGGRQRAEAEAMESARSLSRAGVAALLVDTSPRPNPFARRLAEEMRANYVPLPYADATTLSQAVRSAAIA